MTPFLQLLLVLAIIILSSKLAGHLCQRYLRQPVVFGELLVGVLLGPSLLNLLHWPLFSGAGDFVRTSITVFAEVGVLLLMFVAGLETDLHALRQVGRAATWSAILGVAAPMLGGMLVAHLFGVGWPAAVMIGTVLTATSVSISAQTLLELGQLRSRAGSTILGAAIIDDIIGIVILAFATAFLGEQAASHGESAQTLVTSIISHITPALSTTTTMATTTVAVTVLLMIAFFGMALTMGQRLVTRALAWADRLHASHAVPAMAILLVLCLAVVAAYVGQVAAITGAFLAGLFAARTPYRMQIEQNLHPFIYAFFVPIFFISIGLSVDVRALGGGSVLFPMAIIIVAIVTKILGCGVGARLTGFSSRESLQVGVGMVSRGEIGLIIAQIGVSTGAFLAREYAALILMILVSTVVTPLLLRASFPREPLREADVYESVVIPETEESEERYV